MWVGHRAISDGIKCWALALLWGLRLDERSSQILTLLSGDWLPAPFPTPAVSGSGWPVSTNLLGQGSLFALPRAKPGGPAPEVLCYSAKTLFSSPASVYEEEIKPWDTCSPGLKPGPQVSFLGRCSPQDRVKPPGKQNPSPSSPAHLWWWASSSLPLFSPFPPLPPGGPVRPELGCWVSSQPWIVLVLVLVHSSQENHQRGLLPLPVAWCARLCFLWEPETGSHTRQGMYCNTSEFWSELGSPGEACTGLSQLLLAREAQDQVRSELETSAG